jgi:NAD(P)-dependent dehydrogenase (short-subunit alcohol dehydrogenase family)
MKASHPPGGCVLVTGSSTGIGRACAIHLAARGFHVLGTTRGRAGPDESLAGQRSLELDVTDATSVRRAADEVEEIVGEDGLRGLINNAGICVAGPVETLSLDAWRRQFDVNLFGQIAVTQAMLPLLRRHVSRHGRRTARIVMIGSLAGRVSQPIVAAYCASKHALAAVSDALRNELKLEGIGVSLVEPGAFRTEIWEKAAEQTERLIGTTPRRYLEQIAAVNTVTRHVARTAAPAGRVARVVEDCLTRARPPGRVLVGGDARFITALRAWLPLRWFDSLQRWAMERAFEQRQRDAAANEPAPPPGQPQAGG